MGYIYFVAMVHVAVLVVLPILHQIRIDYSQNWEIIRRLKQQQQQNNTQ